MGSSAWALQLVQATTFLVVLWFSLQISSCSLVQGKKSPKSLQFYVHERRTPPASLTLVAPATASISNLTFGSMIVIDNTVRETAATDSRYLGRQLGSVVVGSDFSFYASYTYLLNTTQYGGSLTVAGIVQTGTLIVTGGTGTFSFARGVATVQAVLDSPIAAVYNYTIHLEYQ